VRVYFSPPSAVVHSRFFKSWTPNPITDHHPTTKNWPHAAIIQPHYYTTLLTHVHYPPEWLIFSPRSEDVTTAAVLATHYLFWGDTITMEAYQLRAKHLTPRRFSSNALFAETLNANVQCTMSDAYLTVGTLHYKPGTSELDFHGTTLAAVKANLRDRVAPTFMAMSTWPQPPTTAAPLPLPPHSHHKTCTSDYHKWIHDDHADWFAAFLEPHRSQARTFLQNYKEVADKLATDATTAGPGNTSHLRWTSVPTLSLTYW
jgi:hypothetical protein